jgi:hypothetical protein
VNKHCLEEFRKHWTCLDNNNQQLWQCRPAEWKLNKCVFDNLVSYLILFEEFFFYTLHQTIGHLLIHMVYNRNSRKSFPTLLLAKHLYILRNDKHIHTTDRERFCSSIQESGWNTWECIVNSMGKEAFNHQSPAVVRV